MEKYVIAVLVANHSGVLTRVSSMFTRRGFNIDSLTVGETESPEFSRITITFCGDEATKEQVVKQLAKLYDVLEVKVLERPDSISRELLLIKVANSPETREEILAAVTVFRAKVIDYSKEALCCLITGESPKIEAFIDLLKPFGILEMCRTGVVALERGSTCLKSK